MVCHDTPPCASYPFTYSPPDTPPIHLPSLTASRRTPPRLKFRFMSSSPEGNTPLSQTLEPAPGKGGKSDTKHPHTSTCLDLIDGVEITLLTLNTQKAGSNSPSLGGIITVIGLHSPDFFLLAEILANPHNIKLSHTLSNRGYELHYNHANAPSRIDILPKSCLHNSITHHDGGDGWHTAKKALWAPTLRALSLPRGCPASTLCTLELDVTTDE